MWSDRAAWSTGGKLGATAAYRKHFSGVKSELVRSYRCNETEESDKFCAGLDFAIPIMELPRNGAE